MIKIAVWEPYMVGKWTGWDLNPRPQLIIFLDGCVILLYLPHLNGEKLLEDVKAQILPGPSLILLCTVKRRLEHVELKIKTIKYASRDE